MKYIILVVICLMMSVSSYSQSKSEKVKERLEELFVLSKSEKYEQAASYIVYRGDDQSRRWKDFYDYENESESKEVKSVCKHIKSYLESTSEEPEFVKFQTEKESEGEWCIWQVNFGSGENSKVYFAFVKIKGKYCLGDID